MSCVKDDNNSAAIGEAAPSSKRGVSLPVVGPSPKMRGTVARSRSGPRRAGVLLLVQVLIAGHIAWWWWRGDTLTPVEPSEAMETLDRGVVNAGAVFLGAAILLQLIFGRFMCGWACHVVALQDACTWLMNRCGVRPKPLRSRILVFAPLVLAFSMFVWPTLNRTLVAPWLDARWPAAADLLGRPAPFAPVGFTARFVTDGLWDTMPTIAVAIPFLLVCGFLCVYLLGSKGFCTYGCPYGGIFSPVDRISLGRIVVDHDLCESCGHCTAACGSNVRVHEEIKAFGMVVDSGCMKGLDCVSVCPNEALSYRLAAPPVVKKHPRPGAPARVRRVYDMTVGEELAMAAVFLATFLACRGAYEVIPSLFAMGIAPCVTFLVWKCWRLFRDRDVRLMAWQLKRASKWRLPGLWLVLLTLGMLALVAHTGVVNYHRGRGDAIFNRLALSKEVLLSPGPDGLVQPAAEGAREQARLALSHYELIAPHARGGLGLAEDTRVDLHAALLRLALGDAQSARADLRRVLAINGEQDELLADLCRVMALAGDPKGAADLEDEALRRHPEFWSLRELRAARQIQASSAEETLKEADAALAAIPDTWRTRTARARTQMTAAWALSTLGRMDQALERLRTAAAIAPKLAVARFAYGQGLLQIRGDATAALVEVKESVRLDPNVPERRVALGQIELALDHPREAAEQFAVAIRLQRTPARAEQLRAAAQSWLTQAGHPEMAQMLK